MSYLDALSRIDAIQAQLTALADGPAAVTSQTSASGATAPASTPTSFAAPLAQAPPTATQSPGGSTVGMPGSVPVGTPGSVPVGTPGSVPVGMPGSVPVGMPGSVPVGMPQALPVAAGGALGVQPTTASLGNAPLTASQQAFAQRLAADTGLDPHVIAAWLLAEESGGAATARESQGNNDWLNIGYTDSGTYGSGDTVWSNPVAAADATAGWLAGQNTIPGYGTASAGVQAILRTAGQPPQLQISAIQGSGWASSGYPDLPSLYAQVAG